jgi:hypothetical protein
MAAITSTTVVAAGVTASAGSVASSDTIAEAQFGTTGVILRVINGSGASVDVTVSDPGTTPMGNAGTAVAVAVGAGVTKMIFIARAAINASTGVATVSYSATTTITYELYRI